MNKAEGSGVQSVLFSLQPLTHLWGLVIRHIVGDQMDFGSVVVANKLFEESYERIGIEPLHEKRMPFRDLSILTAPITFALLRNGGLST